METWNKLAKLGLGMIVLTFGTKSLVVLLNTKSLRSLEARYDSYLQAQHQRLHGL